jgi:hypothetical protein
VASVGPSSCVPRFLSFDEVNYHFSTCLSMMPKDRGPRAAPERHSGFPHFASTDRCRAHLFSAELSPEHLLLPVGCRACTPGRHRKVSGGVVEMPGEGIPS